MSDSNPPTIDPELLIHILIETESDGRIGIPSTFSRDIVIAHKILLRDADFAEVKLAMGRFSVCRRGRGDGAQEEGKRFSSLVSK
jgi:hypothetical protein